MRNSVTQGHLAAAHASPGIPYIKLFLLQSFNQEQNMISRVVIFRHGMPHGCKVLSDVIPVGRPEIHATSVRSEEKGVVELRKDLRRRLVDSAHDNSTVRLASVLRFRLGGGYGDVMSIG
jgi:hypothetical protein